MEKPKRIAFFILRITMGIAFFTFGMGKIMQGPGNFAAHMLKQFSGKLPEFLLIPYVWSLPFIETILGLLLILGLFTTWSLAATGLLVTTLTFGAIIGLDPATTANNLIYAALVLFLLWNVKANTLTLDNKLGLQQE